MKFRMEVTNVLDRLAMTLSSSRFRHVRRTVQLAGSLASRHHVDLRQAVLAAALHDCGKLRTYEVQRRALKRWKVTLDSFERKYPVLWHAPLGAMLAWRMYGIKDRAVRRAIRRHTTAAAGMTKLEMLVYLADALEPGRRYPGVNHLRRLAGRSLELAFREALRAKVVYVMAQGRPVHPRAWRVWNNLVR